ncbi:fumarylacetoacetate hydrolase family protein [Bordetella avium]|nr:fumarylacetoacetate hydrolase family protein [Bordetella avium]
MMPLQTSTSRPSPAIGTVYGVLLNDPATVERITPSFSLTPYKNAPKAPILYIKPQNTLAGEGAAVAIPVEPGVVRIDATVGVVFGRAASRVSAEHALAYVAGYIVVSDITLPHEDYYRPPIAQRCRDGFCPIGPMQDASQFDLAHAKLSVSINGNEVMRRSLSNMVRPLPQLIADVTEFLTLSPGDVLLLGAPEGAPLAYPGDSIRIEVDGLGSLSHTLVVEELA